MTIEQLIIVADAYKTATGIDSDTTVSYRVFGDSKKLRALRSNSDITTRRLRSAFTWFSENWPAEASKPEALLNYAQEGTAQ